MTIKAADPYQRPICVLLTEVQERVGVPLPARQPLRPTPDRMCWSFEPPKIAGDFCGITWGKHFEIGHLRAWFHRLRRADEAGDVLRGIGERAGADRLAGADQREIRRGSACDLCAAKELIGRRAYAIWENEGRPEGQHERHWEQARQDMSAVTPINETGVVQNESEPGALSALPMGKRSVRHPLLGEPIGGSDARS
jgi:hypothetical protein